MTTTYHLPPHDLIASPLLTRKGAVDPAPVGELSTAAREALHLAREAQQAAREVSHQARHAAQVLATLSPDRVGIVAESVGIPERVFAQIIAGTREATPEEAAQIAEGLAAMAPAAKLESVAS